MTFEEIIDEIRTCEGVPVDALRAGLRHAGELAPRIYELVDKAVRGVYLLPQEEDLFYCGLYILAAARQPDLYPQVLALLRVPQDELERLFSMRGPTSLTQLMLSVWDGDADRLFALLEDTSLESGGKCAVFDAVARLTFDGRIPRNRTATFLARFEDVPLAEDDDFCWLGWENAVSLLGMRELLPALRRVWRKEVFDDYLRADRAEALRRLRQAVRAPGDASDFENDDIVAVDDPVAAMGWVERRAQAMAEHRLKHQTEYESDVYDEDDAEEDDADDVARHLRLSGKEQEWLAGFLDSRQVPDGTMPFEMLDGFLTALVIGPTVGSPLRYLPLVWDEDGKEEVVWDNTEQLEYFVNLITKHWNAIAFRRNADAAHAPWILQYRQVAGRDWAEGFIMGTEVGGQAWEPLLDDRRAVGLVMPIYALYRDDPELFEKPLTSDDREEVLDQLPQIVQVIAAYWREGRDAIPRQEPVRSTKVGRNEPCPCGSGKKLKKCCGGASSSTVH